MRAVAARSKQQGASPRGARGSGPEAREKKAPLPRLEWTTTAQLNVHCRRQGMVFAVTLQHFKGVWNGLGVCSPELSDEGDRDARRAIEHVFGSHGHAFVACTPDLALAQRQAEAWVRTAPVPRELCACPEVPSRPRSRARPRKARP